MQRRVNHPAWAGCLFTIVGVAAAGCGSSSSPPPPAFNLNKAANDPSVSSPFDATPDVDGTNIYFTATGANGAGVFKVAAAGGPIAEVFSGDPFVSPFSIAISDDGQTLYVADLGAETTANDGGVIFSLPIGGGTPDVVSGTDGVVPRGLEVANGQLYFTGNDSTGAPGLFMMPLGGGTPATIANGPLFHEPSGVTVTKAGVAYVVDASSTTSSTARLLKVTGGAASIFVDSLAVGYPAGVALTMDESTLLLSALDPVKGTDAVIMVNLASQKQGLFTTGIDTFLEAAGLHRAKTKDVLAWADSAANNTGTVYVLSK
jgi:DNA-binding beta-propeller fold protein YncE